MLATMSLEDARWAAVVARDKGQDRGFYFSVATTGVYCRPSCGARTPRRRNVAFHEPREAAEAAGFRPCKRCRPDLPPRAERDAALVAEACRTIESAETPPALADLAKAARLSPQHFHRLFKAVAGVTPKAYAQAHRARRVREALPKARSVTEAIYEAGFNSNGRFYAASDALLGMTPSRYRAGGARTAMRFAVGECSLGHILVAASDKGVCAILLGDDPEILARELQDRFPRAEIIGGEPGFEAVVAQVVAFVEAPACGLGLPLDIQGAAFQRRVWEALRDIGAGETRSYGDIAAAIGAPGSARAVAGACAANPLAVAIPCHRVIRRDGGLSGYRWGVERKRLLLAREAEARSA